MKSSPAEGVEVREVEKRDNFIPSPALNLLIPSESRTDPDFHDERERFPHAEQYMY